jgi:hypothetical protein
MNDVGDVLVKLAVPLLNALGTLLPQVIGFFDRIRASGDLSADGRALLDGQEALLLARKKRAEEIAANPLPPPSAPSVPDPKPTRPG